MTNFNTNQPGDAALTLVNFPALRQRCIERLLREPAVTFTQPELDELVRLFALAARAHVLSARYQGPTAKTGHRDWRDNTGLVIINRDCEELGFAIPKWTLLFAWLAPESAAAHCPDLVVEVATRMFANTLGEQDRPPDSPRKRR